MKFLVFLLCLSTSIQLSAQSKRLSIEHFNSAIEAYNKKDYQTAVNEYSMAIEYDLSLIHI